MSVDRSFQPANGRVVWRPAGAGMTDGPISFGPSIQRGLNPLPSLLPRGGLEPLGHFLLAAVPRPYFRHDAGADVLGDPHRAEARPAHRAELGRLEGLAGQGLVVHGAGRLGIEGELELPLPVEGEPGPA